MQTILLAIVVFLTAAGPLGAIELALEENRAEHGSIGFVDMQRIFKLFPETTKAKESFEEAVRQAEEEVNLRKAKVLRLRAEIDELKVARAAVPAGAAAAPHLPGYGLAAPPSASTGTVALPGAAVSTNTVTLAPGIHISSAVLNGTTISTGPVTLTSGILISSTILNGAAAAQTPTLSPTQELDEKIAQKSQELAQAQSEAKDQQTAVEVNLLDLESHKSEILLGKIYRAIQEVSRREGVGVVVDKSAILYGHNAVDLTDKVLKYLKGS